MDEVHHSVDLDLTYQISDSLEGMVLVFEDGVAYTLSETLIVADEGFTGTDIRALHKIKKTFDGELQPGVRLLGIVVPACPERSRRVPLPAPKPLKRLEQPPAGVGIEILTLDLGIVIPRTDQGRKRKRKGLP